MDEKNGFKAIIDFDERSWFLRFVDKATFFALLAVCIYLSKDNTWWTLFTAFLFIFTVACWAHHSSKKRTNTFKSKRALKDWVEKLPED